MLNKEQISNILRKMEQVEEKYKEKASELTPFIHIKFKKGEIDNGFNTNLMLINKYIDMASGANEAIKVLRAELTHIVLEGEKNDKSKNK